MKKCLWLRVLFKFVILEIEVVIKLEFIGLNIRVIGDDDMFLIWYVGEVILFFLCLVICRLF